MRKLTAGFMAAFLAVALIVQAQDYQAGGVFLPDRDMQLLGRVDVTGSLFPPRTNSPAQTLDGSIVWDSDGNLLTVGTGTTLKTLLDTNSTQSVSNKTFTASTVTSNTATGAIGYAAGAGCTVAQATDRSTGVTCAGVTGKITTDATSLAAGAEASFTVTNTSVAVGDTIIVSARSGQTAATSIPFVTTVAAGSFVITLTNVNASTADTGAMIINFAILRAIGT